MPHESLDLQRLQRYDEDTSEYPLAIITDEDKSSRVELEDGLVGWQSTIRYDRLIRHVDDTGKAAYRIEEIPSGEGGQARITSLVAEGGRGAEFSELVLFGQRLVAFDDRTGLVCEVRAGHLLVPRQILMTGSGDEKFKGFKSEWATLKGDQLIVGSHGKNAPEEWIKVIDTDYRLESRDWHEHYRRMRAAVGVEEGRGYVTHEAAEWHPLHQCWYFFPRKISPEPFDEPVDESERGGATLIIADEAFEDIRTMQVGERVPDRGVSSFKAIPGHPDEFVGLKSVECGETVETYLFCFDREGRVLQADTFIGSYKCEGVEIL